MPGIRVALAVGTTIACCIGFNMCQYPVVWQMVAAAPAATASAPAVASALPAAKSAPAPIPPALSIAPAPAYADDRSADSTASRSNAIQRAIERAAPAPIPVAAAPSVTQPIAVPEKPEKSGKAKAEKSAKTQGRAAKAKKETQEAPSQVASRRPLVPVASTPDVSAPAAAEEFVPLPPIQDALPNPHGDYQPTEGGIPFYPTTGR